MDLNNNEAMQDAQEMHQEPHHATVDLWTLAEENQLK